MNIGIFHFKVGDTDGVSLEITKWRNVLEELGNSVYLCAGDLGSAGGTLIEEMFHHRPDAERLYRNTFIALSDYDEQAYQAELLGLAKTIEDKLASFVARNDINFLIPQNVWSVAANPAVAIAITRIMRRFKLSTLAHNHDFYWERVDGVALTCATAVELADKYLPPRDPLARHVVINSLAQKELLARKGIDSTVVPNVFDFQAPPWRQDDYNLDFRYRLGLHENDLIILQATRIVPRKGIELAIDFVRALGNPKRRALLQRQGLYDGRPFNENNRIVLVMAGYANDDSTGQYLGRLKDKIDEAGIDALFIEDMVGASRELQNGEKIYSLWDSYVLADFVTYPSLWEGWGNQLLETLRARLPLLLFEYPVYTADIKDKGFRVVSLGSELIGRDNVGLAVVDPEEIENSADRALELLTNSQLREETVDHNFKVAQKLYSLTALKGYLSQLIAR